MVNMTHRPNVDVRLRALELRLAHGAGLPSSPDEMLDGIW
jgi:hypothetical protein